MLPKLGILTILYFVQGMPYGLQARFLPLYLHGKGRSLSSIGVLNLVLLPWLFKALWAPLVDKYGTKRQWLIGSVAGLTLTCLVVSAVDTNVFHVLCGLLFVMNVCASTQDVAVDSLAISILDSEELAHGNMVQVVAYKLGAISGGGFMVWLSEILSWNQLFYLLTFVYSLTVVWLCTSNIGVRCESGQAGDIPLNGCTGSSIVTIWRNILLVPGTVWILGFLLIYKLGETGALSLLPLMLVDHGYVASNITFWTAVVGDGLSVAGSLFAGHIAHLYRGSLYRLLLVLCYLRFIAVAALFVMCILLKASSKDPFLYVGIISVMLVLLTLSGFTTTVTFTLMMHCTQGAPQAIQATHYTTLATVEVLGKLLFSSASAVLADYYGFIFVYSLLSMLSGVVCVFVQFRKNIVLHSLCPDSYIPEKVKPS